MKKSVWYILWGILYALTAGLGFVRETEGLAGVCRVTAAVLFFVPPVMLLLRGDARDRKLIFRISCASLSLTLLVLICSVVLARGSEFAGLFLHGLLGLVSAPMFCGIYWVMPLFFWACLMLTAAGKKDKPDKK